MCFDKVPLFIPSFLHWRFGIIINRYFLFQKNKKTIPPALLGYGNDWSYWNSIWIGEVASEQNDDQLYLEIQ